LALGTEMRVGKDHGCDPEIESFDHVKVKKDSFASIVGMDLLFNC
jgi:hypothetical protein